MTKIIFAKITKFEFKSNSWSLDYKIPSQEVVYRSSIIVSYISVLYMYTDIYNCWEEKQTNT